MVSDSRSHRSRARVYRNMRDGQGRVLRVRVCACWLLHEPGAAAATAYTVGNTRLGTGRTGGRFCAATSGWAAAGFPADDGPRVSDGLSDDSAAVSDQALPRRYPHRWSWPMCSVRERMQLERPRLPSSIAACGVQAKRLRATDPIRVAVSRRHVGRRVHVRRDRSRHVRRNASAVPATSERRAATAATATAATATATAAPETCV
jgi:hypothetical protein